MAEGNSNGSVKGWALKIAGVAVLAMLGWMAAQLQAIPTHGYQLQNHEGRISEVERQQAAAKAATEELIALLKAEARERKARGR